MPAPPRPALPLEAERLLERVRRRAGRFSLNAGPASWKPTGKAVARRASPHGIEIAGIPASDIGTVQKSLRYIASGSAVFGPELEGDRRARSG